MASSVKLFFSYGILWSVTYTCEDRSWLFHTDHESTIRPSRSIQRCALWQHIPSQYSGLDQRPRSPPRTERACSGNGDARWSNVQFISFGCPAAGSILEPGIVAHGNEDGVLLRGIIVFKRQIDCNRRSEVILKGLRELFQGRRDERLSIVIHGLGDPGVNNDGCEALQGINSTGLFERNGGHCKELRVCSRLTQGYQPTCTCSYREPHVAGASRGTCRFWRQRRWFRTLAHLENGEVEHKIYSNEYDSDIDGSQLTFSMVDHRCGSTKYKRGGCSAPEYLELSPKSPILW